MVNQNYYYTGETIEVGDIINIACGFRFAEVLAIYPADHEESIYYQKECGYNMEYGCIELSPNTIEELPLGIDFKLERRAYRRVEPLKDATRE